ncbi:MAG: disulfide bond formation protein B [Ilumatobacter sp.]|nr:disulfide bond formation protein B [Ilumatobacter sp.]
MVLVGLVVPRGRILLAGWAVPLAAAIATGAMAGSLYFSEVADFIPCKLCWFQRIAMYPLAVLLVLAAVWRDRRIFRYVVPIAAVGAVVSGYHVWIQWFPEQSNFCEFTNPCSATWVDAFGFLSIPQMAGICFVLIATIGSVSMIGHRRSAQMSPPL